MNLTVKLVPSTKQNTLRTHTHPLCLVHFLCLYQCGVQEHKVHHNLFLACNSTECLLLLIIC